MAVISPSPRPATVTRQHHSFSNNPQHNITHQSKRLCNLQPAQPGSKQRNAASIPVYGLHYVNSPEPQRHQKGNHELTHLSQSQLIFILELDHLCSLRLRRNSGDLTHNAERFRRCRRTLEEGF